MVNSGKLGGGKIVFIFTLFDIVCWDDYRISYP